jgi:hypothetical protein
MLNLMDHPFRTLLFELFVQEPWRAIRRTLVLDRRTSSAPPVLILKSEADRLESASALKAPGAGEQVRSDGR